MVNSNIINRSAKVLAQSVILVFNPVIMPMYLFLILVFYSSLLANNTMAVKLSIVKMVGFITLLTPLISLGASVLVTKLLKENSSDRYNNVLSSAILTVSYLLAIYILKDYLTLKMSLRLFIAPLFIILQYNLFKLKDIDISVWGASASALATFLYLLSLHNIGGVIYPLYVAIMVCGLVGSSRMYLGRDTGLSLSMGYIIGVIASLISFYTPQ